MHGFAARDDVVRSGAPEDDDTVLRILVVEDDEGDAVLVREHLQDGGLPHETVWVRTVDDALSHLAASDCVLLDLGLPDAMGLGALQRVLAAGAPPVVVLTGLSDTDAGVEAVAAGAQDYLVKGDVGPDLLARAVRYAVQRRRLEDTGRALYQSLVRAAETTRLERALLPTPAVRDPRLEVRVGYRAGRDGLLGGDFYDVVERPDGTVLVMVGDVCGHGPDEAALGATLRTAWRTLVLAGIGADEILELLERVLAAERARPEIFTTVSMLAVHPDRRTADLYLAGHPVPLRLGPPSALLPAGQRGRALGIPVGGGWPAERLELGDRWRLLFYTDGLLEATVGDGTQRLGKAGLLEVADRTLRGDVETDGAVRPDEDPVVGMLLSGVRARHGGDLVDDAAVVLVGWGG
ncbi:response regulator receiver modulated serine phosphatase [Cellulomonas flavigena DSM 20109]|uniref:Response regulator receiver modulated serine phosphatase n=1 Tax=Cellulomonas flavigena (strain ATCC 482 / DSM 20109 / BCRC 11376 / JCM 18109 / NBRC 3775 / NCIMB 8073 / NRS 134) TaxID=446466 RepID=D5UDR6_CELFN|nr:SpoIIE family protein phosphatase [Cellulomonas flavigena]ADG74474.1 response regulator receiver modulated serine phosphatase [Cellulomonas flavigena DSM 20109]